MLNTLIPGPDGRQGHRTPEQQDYRVGSADFDPGSTFLVICFVLAWLGPRPRCAGGSGVIETPASERASPIPPA